MVFYRGRTDGVTPWRRGKVVVIRSTWDYVVHPAAFVAWLDHLDVEQAIVHNPTSLLRWNADKGYLIDLARRGLPVVPTALVAPGDPFTLDDLFLQHGWDDVVIKPAVGGTARFTEHAAAIGANAAEAHLRRVVADEDTVVQPYISTITTSGEISVVVIAGQPLVAVVKMPNRVTGGCRATSADPPSRPNHRRAAGDLRPDGPCGSADAELRQS